MIAIAICNSICDSVRNSNCDCGNEGQSWELTRKRKYQIVTISVMQQSDTDGGFAELYLRVILLHSR